MTSPHLSSSPLGPDQLHEIEQLFKRMDQPLWIVTTACGERTSGLTATWVHQASVDRDNPMVMLGLAPNHFTCELLLESQACAIHLLRPDQHEVALHFAKPSSRDFDKLDLYPTQTVRLSGTEVESTEVESTEVESDSGKLDLPAGGVTLPVLTDCHSALICQTLQTFDAGDRIYFLCRVIRIEKNDSQEILRESTFFNGCSPEQIERLKADLIRDVTVQRPLLRAWLKGVSGPEK